MARSVQKTFKGAGDGTGGGGGDDELLKQAQEAVRANHETMRQNLLHLQSLEMKHLEGRTEMDQRAKGAGRFSLRPAGNSLDQSAL